MSSHEQRLIIHQSMTVLPVTKCVVCLMKIEHYSLLPLPTLCLVLEPSIVIDIVLLPLKGLRWHTDVALEHFTITSGRSDFLINIFHTPIFKQVCLQIKCPCITDHVSLPKVPVADIIHGEE